MEFEDHEAFEGWLEEQSLDVCTAIACRAAFRVWPLAIADSSWKRVANFKQETATISTARALLTASTMSQCLSDELKIAANQAVESCRQAARMLKRRNLAFQNAAEAAISIENVLLTSISRYGVSAARIGIADAYRASGFLAEFSMAVYQDADFDAQRILERPLWHKIGAPDELMPNGNRLTILDTDFRFSFFARWYDAMVRGAPLDWELQRRVALIPQETWEAGADAVAEAIADVEADYLREKAPLAERVEFNEETNRFRVVPIPMQNAAFMSALMSRTADALDDALHGNNGLREDMREVRVLRRTHARYSNDPQRVEMDYTSVAVSLRRNLDAKELADSEDNLALLEAVEDGVRGLRAHHPEVAANRETLAKQAMRELPADQIALLEDAQDILPEITEGVMQEDFARDIPKLINDATLPLPTGAPPLPGADEATRIFSRSAGIKLSYEKTRTAGAAAFDSKDFKTVRLGLTVWSLLKELVTLGLRLFGVF